MSVIISSSREKIRVPPPTSGDTLQLTVGTTPIQLPSKKIQSVTIKADDDNSGSIYVGFSSNVSPTTGFRLVAGQAIDIAIDELSKIWLVADTANQKAHILWVV